MERDEHWSERRFRSLVEATATEVFRNAPDGRLLSDMPRWRELTGQTAQDIRDFGWLDALHPDDLPRIDAAWRAAVEAGTAFDGEYRVRRAGGGWAHVWVRSAPLRDDRGEVVEYVGLYHDVSERVARARRAAQLESELDVERGILERVVATSPVGVAIVWGPEHRFRRVNREFTAMVPGDRRWEGRTVAEALPEAGDLLSLLDAARAGERIDLPEVELDFGGVEKFYRALYTPLPDADGAPGGVLCTVIDTTSEVLRRRGLQRELDRERRVAEMLQRSLLPDVLPDIPGVEFCARYEPAGDGAFVGGDWYDVFEAGDGRVAVAVGDVAGRGLQAATVMGQLRAALRAYAIEDPAPATVLTRMDELVDRLGRTATLAYGLLDPAAGRLEQGLAGHPPPLLVPDGERARWLDSGLGAPLGAAIASRATIDVDVPRRGLVLYYTDGMLSERELGIRSGMVRLRVAAEEAGAGRPELGDVCTTLLAGQGGLDDDRALLALRRT